MRLPSSWRWVKLKEGILEPVIQFHNGSLVATPVAVVWSREDGDYIPIMAPIVSFHHQLVRSGQQCQAVGVVVSLRDILSEGVARPAWRNSPTTTVIGVRPQQVAHRTLMWHFLQPVQSPDVIQGVDAGGQTSVEAEDLIVNEGGEGEIVEQIGEVLPHVGVPVLSQALVVETVNLCDLARFVVASQDGYPRAESHLETDEETDGLYAVVSPVHIVAHEQVVCVRRLPPDAEQLHQIVELAVNIAANCHGAFHILYIAFFGQDLLGLLTERLDLVLTELTTLQELLYPLLKLLHPALFLRVHPGVY